MAQQLVRSTSLTPPARNGQESVWDYPNPPRLEAVSNRLLVLFGGEVVALTVEGYRLIETGLPPFYLIPPRDVRLRFLEPNNRKMSCEFRGQACGWSVLARGRRSEAAAWSYPNPTLVYAPVTNYFVFLPARVDACFVDDDQVQALNGDLVGCWITPRVVGPFGDGPGLWAC